MGRYNLKIKVGSYTGDGGTNRALDIGMPSKFFAAKRRIGTAVAVWGATDLPNATGGSFGAGAESASGILHVNENGCSMSSSSNINAAGNVYDYFAFDGDQSVFSVGSYAGTGVDDRNFTDTQKMSFTPNWVYCKGSGATTSRYKTALMTSTDSGSFSTAIEAADHIQSFISGGFQLGTNANVNGSGTLYRYMAMRTNSNFYYETTFTGNGTSQTITGVPFNPDLIIAKCNSTTNSIGLWFSTNPAETQFLTSTAPATDAITSATGGTITIGANALVNENAVQVRLMCFKAGEYLVPFSRSFI